MPNQLGNHSLSTQGAAAIAGHFLGEASYSTLEYYSAARSRTAAATFVLAMFAKAVSSVNLARGVDRDELFERYDVKLWSFNDNVALFALATAPSVAILAVLYASFRGVETIRSAFGL